MVPVFLGACVAAVPSAKTVHDTQLVHADPRLDVPAMDGGTSALASKADAPGQPIHAVEESAEQLPSVEAEVEAPEASFTRTIDRARIEARGAARAEAGFDPVALQTAAAFDNEAWLGDQRRELLTYLRRDLVEKHAEFTAADARIVAQLQAGSGAPIDGQLTDATMAVLLATGFHFSMRRAMSSEVKLEFYPGELEDLDAWNREIDQKVTKLGGGFRDVIGPEGEGTLYVRVGRSIVASYRARGGPPSRLDDDRDHVAEPTKPGVYRLGAGHAHVTSNWYFSQIPWGAEIRPEAGGYQYRTAATATWSWATNNPAARLKVPLDSDDFADLPEVTRGGMTFLVWNKNDFGPIAWNLVPSDHYVHTTPRSEVQAADATVRASTPLGYSHGCVHVDPVERNEMMKRGYLTAGVLFVVRRWDEHLLPEQLRQEMLGAGAARPSKS